ncbi:FecR domain-containing protein [Massilia terrae]|uniref:FecR domain-containing protein n=1 Tax=Massilia terrae TaxID=1811224 RepID=A0ABT2CTA5_9BURK|nr:FecR domain-containing protein [Massilia terrae]MCS0657202.1 FecR domain-containing protein [Massilia terrae]
MAVIDDEALEWALLQAEGELDDQRRRAFQRWYDADVRHKGAYVRAMVINNALSRATVQDNLRPAPSQPEAGGWETQSARWVTRRRLLAFGAMAASVAVLAPRMMTAPREAAPAGPAPLVLATAKGEFRKVPLADQSAASINSASQIEVRYGAHARQVTLARGEAWFEVAKDKSRPFTVQAGAVRAQAVGTAFSVRRDGDSAEILVTEGTVAVWTGEDGERRMVTAGERALVSGPAAGVTVERSPQEVQRRLAWREGKLVFMNQSLKDAVADFNRYSAKTIVIADRSLDRRTLIGQYRTDAPERFARDVSASFNVPYTITAKEILIGRPS